MTALLIASSPVEIETKAEAGDLPPGAAATARRLFRALTDQLGHAGRGLDGSATAWPVHRFYFARQHDPELDAVLEGLRARADYREVTPGVADEVGERPNGLFGCLVEDEFVGLLVGHETHTGESSPAA